MRDCLLGPVPALPGKKQPVASTDGQGQHNVFDFTLKPGEARLLPVVPLGAKDGGVKVVVWLPRKAK